MAKSDSEDSDDSDIFTYKTKANFADSEDSESKEDEDEEDEVEVHSTRRHAKRAKVGETSNPVLTPAKARPSATKSRNEHDHLDMPSPPRNALISPTARPFDNKMKAAFSRNKQMIAQLQAAPSHDDDDDDDDLEIVDDRNGSEEAGASDAGQPLVVKMRTHDGWEQSFTITTVTNMSELFDMFEATPKAGELKEQAAQSSAPKRGRRGKSVASEACFRYLFDGDKIQPSATPKSLDMDDDDVIDINYG